ncbi:MAG TPA: hypothetical protein VFZ23_13995 [Pyrinomonadaceae bacterium]
MQPQILNETGRKTFFWYRIYCTVLAVLYLAVAVFGVFLAVVQPSTPRYDPAELQLMGWIYAILGIVFFIVFAIASLLPAKPYNWIVGIVMLAIGMSSCCLLPAVIPLFIFWIKPETQAFFGRK